MSNNLEVSIRITADGKVLVGEARAASDALNQLGDSTRKVSGDAATMTTQTSAQTASLASMKAGLIAAAGAYVSLGAAISGGKAIIETALANERLANTLTVATGSMEAAARETAFLRDASEKLGLQFVTTSSQYAKLAAAAKGTQLEGQATRDIFLAVAKASTVLGMSAADTGGALLAIQQMISKGKVSAEELRGQLGERLPGAFEMAARAIGVTTAELDKMLEQGQVTAERMLPALARELENTFGAQAQTAAQGLQAKINRLENSFADLKTAIGSTGLLDLLSDGIVLATRFVDALSGAKVLSAVDQQKQKIAEMRAELESLADRKHIPLIGDLLFDKKQADLLSQRIDDGIQDLKKLEQAARESAEAISKKNAFTPGVKPELPKEWAAAAEKVAKEREKAAAAAEREAKRMVDASTRVIESLKLETAQIGLNAIQKKMLVAATEAAKAPTEELSMEIMASAQAWALATQQQEELMAAEKERLDAIKAIEKAEQEAARVAEESARQAAQQWNQLWGSVEQTAKTAFIQFAAHGKSAMESIGESIKIAILDVLYQLTVRKWVINIGTSMEGMFAGGAAGGSSLSTVFNSTSLLNAGKTIFNGFTSGLTGSASGLVSGLGRMVGSEALSAFGAGLSGVGTAGASAGIFSAAGGAGTAFIGGTGTAIGGAGMGAAASMGSSLAAAAGPLAVVAIADVVFRMLAGNKLTGSKVIDSIPIIGSLGALFFGRGPLEQKETNLIGDFTSEGFAGITSTKFKADGGLARSSKVDRVMIDTDTGNLLNQYKGLVEGGISKVLDPFAREAAVAAMQLGKYLDDVTTSTAESMKKVGESLGKGKDAMEGFYYGVNIASEKGKSLTDEQISGVLTEMADTMARHVIPNIDQFRKAGESVADAALRIGNEFDALVNASTILGVSLDDARTVLRGASIEGRTAFIEAAGGIDALGQKADFFAQNFLSGAEQLQRSQELLDEQMSAIGLKSSMTREEFKDLVQSFGQVNGVSEEMLVSLLNIAPLFVQVKNGMDAMGVSLDQLKSKVVLTRDEIYQSVLSLSEVGYDFADAVNIVKTTSPEVIKAFMEANGGLENIAAFTSKFADNFLTDAERLAPYNDYLSLQLQELGFSADMTAEQYRDAVTAQGEFADISNESRIALIGLVGWFVTARGGIQSVASSMGDLSAATPQAVASIQQLVTAGLNMGMDMQRIAGLISTSTSEQLNDFVNGVGGIDPLTQFSEFVKNNFMSADQALAVDMQDLANQLGKLGIATNISRAEFLSLLQTVESGSQRFKDLKNVTELYDSVHDRMESAAQAAANYVPPKPVVLNQDAINTANDNLRTAESNLGKAHSNLANAYKQEQSALQGVVDKFRGLADTLRSAKDALSLSELSPLTPEQKLSEARTQLLRTKSLAESGDADAMGKIPELVNQFLGASRVYNASGAAYTSDFAWAQNLLDSVAGKAEAQASVAEKQLDQLSAQYDRLGDINDGIGNVASAVSALAQAQAAYNAAKSAVPDPVYSNVITTPPSIPVMPGGVDLPTVLTPPPVVTDPPVDTGSNILVQIPGNWNTVGEQPTVSPIGDQQIKEFWDAHIATDPMAIYNAAIRYGVDSKRLSSVVNVPQSDILEWARGNGLPAFERGTNFVQRGGLAVLHPAEAVTPANHMLRMAEELKQVAENLKAMLEELSEIRNDMNYNTKVQIDEMIKSNLDNAARINSGAREMIRAANWNETVKPKVA
ncbi:MAG: tape measure protein [Nitrosomonas sp.]|nr:tape measure protein [Nitrosomonas sp.]